MDSFVAGHRVQQCESCKALFALSFHGEFVHLGSWKIGELVLNRVTISDVIPSNFHGTCIACNATVRLKALVNGESFRRLASQDVQERRERRPVVTVSAKPRFHLRRLRLRRSGRRLAFQLY